MSFARLLDAAIAGVQRVEPPTVLEELADQPGERRLLHGASLEGLRRLAGPRLDRADASQLERCPAEALPVAPPAACARLAEILAYRQELLLEWLRLAQARGFRVPHALLVDLL